MICSLADFNVEFKNPTVAFETFLKDYKSDASPQVAFSITQQDIENVKNTANYTPNALQLEVTAFYDKLLAWLPLNDAMFLHASLIEVENQGVAFTALSGTGKSTHTLLWQKLLGDKMTIINGDKPIIRFVDGIPYGYGTPWNGKEHLGTNGRVPVKHICFIERSKTNSCKKINAKTALKNIFSQIFVPNDVMAATKTLELLNRLLNDCDIWQIKCNTDLEAAEVAYNTIFKEKSDET